MAAVRTVLVAHPGSELFGSDRMALESVRAFREAGDRVVVALPESGPLVDELVASGAQVVILPQLVLRKALMKPSGWLRLFRDTFRGLGSGWRLISRVRPDAIYVSTITIPEWPALARMRGIPSVTHVHEAEASGSRAINTALYVPHLLSNSVVVNSQFSLNTIRASLPSLARRAEVVYNGVLGPENPSEPRAAIEGPLRILYMGRLSPRKGPDLILSAAAMLRAEGREVEVALLGAVFPGYEWYEEQLRTQIAESDLDGHVVFLGFQPDIWPHVAHADVLVVPSRLDESFGNTAVEGILAQRPVVVSDTSGLREAAGGYETAWLIAPDDADSIAVALRDITNSWHGITANVSASAVEANFRHSPASYRAKIRRALGA